MKRFAPAPLRRSRAGGLALGWALVAACGSESAPAPPRAPATPVALSDENNYRAVAALSIPTIQTAPAVDLDLCFDRVTTDVQCHELEPLAEIDNIGLLRIFHLGEDEIETKLAHDDLLQAEVDGYVDYQTDHTTTCAKLSNLSFFATEVALEQEYVESDDRTYLLLFATGKAAGRGARSMAFIRPVAGVTNTRVDAPAGCGIVDFEADLASAAPVAVPARGPFSLEWRGVQTNGLGNPFAHGGVDRLLLGFYAGMSVTEVQARVFDLELIATELFDLRLASRSADLALATERTTGEPFTGLSRDEDGTWVLGLLCSTCQSPAPLLLSVLVPEGAGS
jgi:hypothetical protein